MLNERFRAKQVIPAILQMVERPQVVAYLEATGWKKEDYPDQTAQFYRFKSATHSAVILLPYDFGKELPGDLQECLERMAYTENTTFVGIVCKILCVSEIVLKPPL